MYLATSPMPYSAGCRVADASRTTYSMSVGSTKTSSTSCCSWSRRSVVITGTSGDPLDDDELVHLARVSNEDFQHESIHLGLGKRVGALGLDRVLCSHDEEGIGHLVRLAADRDLVLLHDLEQRALHLRRRAVDLVGEKEVCEDRAERGLEVACALVVDPCADKVGGHEIGRELDALEVAGDGLSDGLHRQRLRKAGNTFDEQVAAGEQADHEPLDQVVLPDDHFLDLEKKPARVRRHRCLYFCHQPFTPSSPAARRA